MTSYGLRKAEGEQTHKMNALWKEVKKEGEAVTIETEWMVLSPCLGVGPHKMGIKMTINTSGVCYVFGRPNNF